MHTLPKAITFDCYGTLIDWEAEIQRYFAQKLAEHNITDINARALQGYWEEVQFQSIQGPYLPYRQVLRETMKLAFDYFHVPYAETDVEEFANAMGRWKPFPDTRDAIVALQRYVKEQVPVPSDGILRKCSWSLRLFLALPQHLNTLFPTILSFAPCNMTSY